MNISLEDLGVKTQSSPLRAWLVSLVVHLVLLLVIGLVTKEVTKRLPALMVVSTPPETLEEVNHEALPEFKAELVIKDAVGGSAVGGVFDDAPGGVVLPEEPPVIVEEQEPQDFGQIEYREMVEAMTGPSTDLNKSIKGMAGAAVSGADGAVDQITQEILLSLEERPTLVVWFFDRSGSLTSQRAAIRERFHRIYEELGAAGVNADAMGRRLLAGVVSFGRDVQFPVERPTDLVSSLQEAVDGIEQDDSGEEMVFTALRMAEQRFRRYATTPRRNVLFVVFSDEAGSDQEQLDATVELLRRRAIPVYVVGVPAPFGRRETFVKYVDPDPDYDQSVMWGRVDQGPESLRPEGVNVEFQEPQDAEPPIDSGYGPFALTRLCYETGGIYFTVHPNRRVGQSVGRGEIANYSAFLQAFFDPDIMRRYRPDYVSAKEYERRVKANRARAALVEAAEMSLVTPLENPRRRFVFRDEAAFAQELTEAQKEAARREPLLTRLHEVLARGEADRDRETEPRWEAGYDLAMGRVLAAKVRTETYNLMLAQAKQGLKFQDAEKNTWQLEPADQVTAGSRHERDAAKAREYLERVVKDHPGTPWALLAERELSAPLSWQWSEEFTPVAPSVAAVADNNPPPPPPPSDEQRRMLERPAKKRPLPKL